MAGWCRFFSWSFFTLSFASFGRENMQKPFQNGRFLRNWTAIRANFLGLKALVRIQRLWKRIKTKVLLIFLPFRNTINYDTYVWFCLKIQWIPHVFDDESMVLSPFSQRVFSEIWPMICGRKNLQRDPLLQQERERAERWDFKNWDLLLLHRGQPLKNDNFC